MAGNLVSRGVCGLRSTNPLHRWLRARGSGSQLCGKPGPAPGRIAVFALLYTKLRQSVRIDPRPVPLAFTPLG